MLLAARVRTYLKRVFVVDSTAGEPKLHPGRRVQYHVYLAARRAGLLERVRYDEVRMIDYWRVR